MTTADFLKRLCEGYVRAYRTLNLRTRAMWTDHTKRELEFFAHPGEMLGFAAILEHERMDLSWRDVDGDEALDPLATPFTSCWIPISPVGQGILPVCSDG
jgi:hypothetical protein